MTPFVVSLMFSAGAATWIYTKFQKYSGNNTRQSVIATTVAGVFIFIMFYLISSPFLK